LCKQGYRIGLAYTSTTRIKIHADFFNFTHKGFALLAKERSPYEHVAHELGSK